MVVTSMVAGWLSHMVLTQQSQGYHMIVTMCYTCDNHGCFVVATWLPHGYQMVDTRLPHGCHMVVTWLSHGCHMTATWLPHSCQMVVTFLSYGCHMVVTWLPHDRFMAVKWLLNGCHMVVSWLFRVHNTAPGHKVTQQSHGCTPWRPVTWKAIIIPLVVNLRSSLPLSVFALPENRKPIH